MNSVDSLHELALSMGKGRLDVAIALHEAGHAIAKLALASTFEVVSLRRFPAHSVGGYVGDAMPSHEPAVFEEVIIPEPERSRAIVRLGTLLYAGAAAEHPVDDAMSLEALDHSLDDRRALVRFALARGGQADLMDAISWHAACALVDVNWGAVLAIAGNLLLKETLTFDEAERIVKAAPSLFNERKVWRPAASRWVEDAVATYGATA